MSKSKNKYIDLCQLANKYKRVVLETLTFNGPWRVTYVTWTVKIVQDTKIRVFALFE